MDSLGEVYRRWKMHIYPVLWVAFIVVFCKTALFQRAHPSTGPSATPSTAAISTGLDSNQHLSLDPSAQYLNINASNKVAVIIETRSTGFLVPLILHFSAVLGPSWPILIYTEAEAFGSFQTSASMLRLQESGRVVLRELPDGQYFPNWNSVSDFLTERWLWENLAPAEHVLLFQTDSILCSNSVRSVDDFFEYDFVGAPIVARLGKGYNGGLSLRKRSTTLRVLDEWKHTKKSKPNPEDQWYYDRMVELRDRDEKDENADGVKLPSMEIARTFAVETIDYPSPLGFHQPTRFLRKHMVSLDEYCPEWKLATKEYIKH